MLWGGKLLVETILRQTRTPLIRALTEEWDKLPQQLPDNVVQTTRGLLATDHVILNHGQVTWTTPELAPPLLTTTPHQREDVSALDRFNTVGLLVVLARTCDKASHSPIPIPLGYRGHELEMEDEGHVC
ncbi:uncharacterized protein TNCV_2594711 [Trichonephila clavipes]|nr:uncharacterized protein TNCV_2594711 [Trichonephila clavipes]